MSFTDSCPCCGRRDGLTSGGCVYCSARTYCACGQLVSCGCGRAFSVHACPSIVFVGLFEPCPSIVFVGLFEPIPTLPLAEDPPP